MCLYKYMANIFKCLNIFLNPIMCFMLIPSWIRAHLDLGDCLDPIWGTALITVTGHHAHGINLREEMFIFVSYLRANLSWWERRGDQSRLVSIRESMLQGLFTSQLIDLAPETTLFFKSLHPASNFFCLSPMSVQKVLQLLQTLPPAEDKNTSLWGSSVELLQPITFEGMSDTLPWADRVWGHTGHSSEALRECWSCLTAMVCWFLSQCLWCCFSPVVVSLTCFLNTTFTSGVASLRVLSHLSPVIQWWTECV